MTRDFRNIGREISAVSRRSVLCAPWVLPVALAGGSAVPAAQPKGVRKLRITKAHTVEVRNVPAGKGLVLPWDAKKTPLDTRDYVVTQFVTDQGLIGTTMDGDYRLPEGIGRIVQGLVWILGLTDHTLHGRRLVVAATQGDGCYRQQEPADDQGSLHDSASDLITCLLRSGQTPLHRL